MRPHEFRELVRRMRASQKEYFRSRDPDQLTLAKDLERQVDAEIGQPKAVNLFDCVYGKGYLDGDPD